jgi:hypothetical protein
LRRIFGGISHRQLAFHSCSCRGATREPVRDEFFIVVFQYWEKHVRRFSSLVREDKSHTFELNFVILILYWATFYG